jgi:hypothetical protein
MCSLKLQVRGKRRKREKRREEGKEEGGGWRNQLKWWGFVIVLSQVGVRDLTV